MPEAAIIDPSYRPLGFASDDSNPNFVGATNPDSKLWAQFYLKPVQNSFKTLEQGRPIFEDRLMIKIQIPGNALSIIDTYATEHHKARFPREWAHFQNTHGKDEAEIGTPLSQWPLLKPSQVEELRAVKFRTVEQVAFASDLQLQSIGMIAGMSPFAFRDRAKLYLDAAAGSAVAQKQADENKKLQEQLAAEKEAREQMEAKHKQEMEELRSLIAAATEHRPRGRPPKSED